MDADAPSWYSFFLHPSSLGLGVVQSLQQANDCVRPPVSEEKLTDAPMGLPLDARVRPWFTRVWSCCSFSEMGPKSSVNVWDPGFGSQSGRSQFPFLHL